MPCVNPNGKPTESGKKMIKAAAELVTLEEIASTTALPLFRVRSGLRDLIEAGYLEEAQGKYMITDEGHKALEE